MQDTVTTDGVTYWFIAMPQGIPMVDVITEGPREEHVAVEITVALGRTMANLVAWGAAPQGIIRHLYWCETGIVLDWAGALGGTGPELPQADGLGDAERLAVTVAAVLHGLLSGKSPLAATNTVQWSPCNLLVVAWPHRCPTSAGPFPWAPARANSWLQANWAAASASARPSRPRTQMQPLSYKEMPGLLSRGGA